MMANAEWNGKELFCSCSKVNLILGCFVFLNNFHEQLKKFVQYMNTKFLISKVSHPQFKNLV